jgi:hypothetical protein
MRSVIVLSVLLAGSLVGSYLTWTAPKETTRATDVVVFDATEDGVSQISWKDETTTVVLERRKDKAGAWFWVDATETKTEAPKAAPPPADGSEPAPPPAPQTVTERSAFLGNESALEVWSAFTPLRALRELPLGADTDLASFGLDQPKAKIEVVKGGATLVLEVGGESYGTKDRYVRFDGKIWLLDDKFLRSLQYAKARMVERRLLPFDEKGLAEISIKAPQGARSFVHMYASDAAKAYYADAGSRDKKDVEGSTWVEKLLRVKSKQFVAEGDVKQPLEPVFAFEAKGADGSAYVTEVLKTGAGPDLVYYARGTFLRGTVELTRTLVQEPADDLPALFDGQDADEDEAAAPSAAPAAPGAAPAAPGSPAPGTP